MEIRKINPNTISRIPEEVHTQEHVTYVQYLTTPVLFVLPITMIESLNIFDQASKKLNGPNCHIKFDHIFQLYCVITSDVIQQLK